MILVIDGWTVVIGILLGSRESLSVPTGWDWKQWKVYIFSWVLFRDFTKKRFAVFVVISIKKRIGNYQSLVPDEITLKLSRISFYPPHDLICISLCRNPTILCIVDLLQKHCSQTASSSNQTVPDIPGYRNTFSTPETGKNQMSSLSSLPKRNTPQT